jgi:hypothetical protein
MDRKELRRYLQAIMDEGISMERLEEIYKRGVDDGVRLSEESKEVVMKFLNNLDK